MRRLLAPVLLSAIPFVYDACAKRTETLPGPRVELVAPASAPVAAATVEAAVAMAPTPARIPAAFDHHCGECHRSDLPTAKPKALAVFDLTHEDWLAKMTKSQVEAAILRMKGMSKA